MNSNGILATSCNQTQIYHDLSEQTLAPTVLYESLQKSYITGVWCLPSQSKAAFTDVCSQQLSGGTRFHSGRPGRIGRLFGRIGGPKGEAVEACR